MSSRGGGQGECPHHEDLDLHPFIDLILEELLQERVFVKRITMSRKMGTVMYGFTRILLSGHPGSLAFGAVQSAKLIF